MTLLSRVALLFKADAHGVVDSLEERTLLLKQFLREGEMLLTRSRARLEALRDEVKRLEEKLVHERDTIERLDEDVSLAMAGGKDDLARFAIRQLLPHRREAERLAGLVTERCAQIESLAERVESQQGKYEKLKSRVRAEISREAEAPESASCFADGVVIADEEVELELMRRRVEEVAP